MHNHTQQSAFVDKSPRSQYTFAPLDPMTLLTRLLVRHGCSEQGGSYVNYPTFVSSFTEAVRGAEPAKAVAAVAAATAAGASMPSSSVPTVPRKRKDTRDGGGESDRSALNPQLALLPPRPSTSSGEGAERATKIFAGRSTPKRYDWRYSYKRIGYFVAPGTC